MFHRTVFFIIVMSVLFAANNSANLSVVIYNFQEFDAFSSVFQHHPLSFTYTKQLCKFFYSAQSLLSNDHKNFTGDLVQCAVTMFNSQFVYNPVSPLVITSSFSSTLALDLLKYIYNTQYKQLNVYTLHNTIAHYNKGTLPLNALKQPFIKDALKYVDQEHKAFNQLHQDVVGMGLGIVFGDWNKVKKGTVFNVQQLLNYVRTWEQAYLSILLSYKAALFTANTTLYTVNIAYNQLNYAGVLDSKCEERYHHLFITVNTVNTITHSLKDKSPEERVKAVVNGLNEIYKSGGLLDQLNDVKDCLNNNSKYVTQRLKTQNKQITRLKERCESLWSKANAQELYLITESLPLANHTYLPISTYISKANDSWSSALTTLKQRDEILYTQPPSYLFDALVKGKVVISELEKVKALLTKANDEAKVLVSNTFYEVKREANDKNISLPVESCKFHSLGAQWLCLQDLKAQLNDVNASLKRTLVRKCDELLVLLDAAEVDGIDVRQERQWLDEGCDSEMINTIYHSLSTKVFNTYSFLIAQRSQLMTLLSNCGEACEAQRFQLQMHDRTCLPSDAQSLMDCVGALNDTAFFYHDLQREIWDNIYQASSHVLQWSYTVSEFEVKESGYANFTINVTVFNPLNVSVNTSLSIPLNFNAIIEGQEVKRAFTFPVSLSPHQRTTLTFSGVAQVFRQSNYHSQVVCIYPTVMREERFDLTVFLPFNCIWPQCIVDGKHLTHIEPGKHSVEVRSLLNVTPHLSLVNVSEKHLYSSSILTKQFIFLTPVRLDRVMFTLTLPAEYSAFSLSSTLPVKKNVVGNTLFVELKSVPANTPVPLSLRIQCSNLSLTLKQQLTSLYSENLSESVKHLLYKANRSLSMGDVSGAAKLLDQAQDLIQRERSQRLTFLRSKDQALSFLNSVISQLNTSNNSEITVLRKKYEQWLSAEQNYSLNESVTFYKKQWARDKRAITDSVKSHLLSTLSSAQPYPSLKRELMQAMKDLNFYTAVDASVPDFLAINEEVKRVEQEIVEKKAEEERQRHHLKQAINQTFAVFSQLLPMYIEQKNAAQRTAYKRFFTLSSNTLNAIKRKVSTGDYDNNTLIALRFYVNEMNHTFNTLEQLTLRKLKAKLPSLNTTTLRNVQNLMKNKKYVTALQVLDNVKDSGNDNENNIFIFFFIILVLAFVALLKANVLPSLFNVKKKRVKLRRLKKIGD